MTESPKVWSAAEIGQAWSWHEWRPRWLPGRFAAPFKHRALAAFAEPGVCALDNGRKMLVRLDDYIQCTIAKNGEWEGLIYQAVKDAVRPGDAVLDVGGHVGYSSLLFADWVGPGGRVVVFEPLPGNAAQIERNLALNDFAARAAVLRIAASDRAGEAKFVPYDSLNSGMGALASGNESRAAITVPTVALDDWLDQQKIASVALVKLDIEGAEILALRGMRRGLASGRYRALLVELHSHQLRSFGSSSAEVIELLKNAGYRLASWENDAFVPGASDRSSYILAQKIAS